MEDLLRPNLDSGMWQQMPPAEVGQLMAARAGIGEQPNGCSPFFIFIHKSHNLQKTTTKDRAGGYQPPEKL